MKSDSGENLFPITAVESGSNSNGHWIKYSDGTMIQWNNTTVNDVGLTTDYGGRGIFYIGYRAFNYPQEFIENPAINCGQFRWGTGASFPMVSGTTKTHFAVYGIDLFSRASGTDILVSWQAIGRWK